MADRFALFRGLESGTTFTATLYKLPGYGYADSNKATAQSDAAACAEIGSLGEYVATLNAVGGGTLADGVYRAVISDSGGVRSHLYVAINASHTIDNPAIMCESISEVVMLASILDQGTAQAGASSTITLRSSASSVDSFYKNAVIVLTGGTGAGQNRRITGYVGSTRVATISGDRNWSTTPDSTTTYIVIGNIP